MDAELSFDTGSTDSDSVTFTQLERPPNIQVTLRSLPSVSQGGDTINFSYEIEHAIGGVPVSVTNIFVATSISRNVSADSVYTSSFVYLANTLTRSETLRITVSVQERMGRRRSDSDFETVTEPGRPKPRPAPTISFVRVDSGNLSHTSGTLGLTITLTNVMLSSRSLKTQIESITPLICGIERYPTGENRVLKSARKGVYGV